MLESVLSKCLKHYLKEYLLPVEPEQMKLKVFKGKFKLMNLEILPTALAFHHIPFIVRKGTIRLVKAIFPWKNLKDESCQVYVEDIFLVLQFNSEIIIKSDLQANQNGIHLSQEANAPSTDEKKNTLQGLFESVIDNLKVSIKNIHIRIEFPSEPSPICIGLILPEITILTVDEDNKPIEKIVHPHFVRKQLLIKDFSIYFDTLSEQISLDNFNETMVKSMTSDHQYLFMPTVFESILIHTKDKTEAITNKIETYIDNIELCLDFHQSRSILTLNTLWRQFMKRRKYVNCLRPDSFSKSDEVWKYAHKCAIVKNSHHVFKPALALAILKNKSKYIDLYKQAKVSKLSAALLGSPKQKLDFLEKKVGKDATIYLRELAEAIFIKEQSMKEQTEITAFDLSELKSIFESTELVFSMTQISASLNIQKFSLNLLYVKGTPLFVVNIDQLYGNLDSLPKGVMMTIRLSDASMVSYINQVSRNIFETKLQSKVENDFVLLHCNIPTTGDVSSIDCNIRPCKVTLDTETMNNILEFFTVQNKRHVDIDEKEIRTVRLDIGEQLQGLKILRNYKMSITMEQMSYDFPFEVENEIKYLTFDMSKLAFMKNLSELIPKNSPEIPMDFDVSLNLTAKIDTFTLLSSEGIKANASIIFINGKFGVELSAKIDLVKLQVFVAQESYGVILVAMNHIMAIPFMQSGVMANSTQQVLMAGRSKMGADINLGELNIFLNDENKENEMKVTIGDLEGSVNYFSNNFQCTAILKSMKIEQFQLIFLEILGKVDLKMEKKSDLDPLYIDAMIIEPHGFMNFDTFEWIIAFSNQLIGYLPKEPLIIEPPELLVNPEEIAPPSLLCLNNSILIQSVDSFVEESATVNLEDSIIASFKKHKTRKESILLPESSCDEFIENENDNSEAPSVAKFSLSLNIINTIFEMVDEGIDEDSPNNSYSGEYGDSYSENGDENYHDKSKRFNILFEIESIALNDPSSEGFVLEISQFSISRAQRYVLKPVDISVPIYLPDPIKVSIDYAESELFPGDINALNVHSPRIFKLMFGGPEPLIKNEIFVDAFAKKGLGSMITENHEAIATATVNDVYLKIQITPTTLIVDVKTGYCDGCFTNGTPFLEMQPQFHCIYSGTMNDQDILVEIPIASTSLKHDLLSWVIGFIPPPPDESTLQPLRVKVDMKPVQVSLYDENQNKNSLLIDIGDTIANAYRDKSLNLDLNLSGVHITSEIFDHPVLNLGKVMFSMNENLMKARIPPLEANLSIPLLKSLIKEVSSLVPENPPSAQSVALANIGIDLILEKISLSLYPTPTAALLLEIPSFKFILNSYFKIAALSIESICISTVVCMNDPTPALILSQMNAIVTFSGNTGFNLSTITVDSIANMKHSGTTKRPLEAIYFSFKMDSIIMHYTHLFAQTIIDCFLNEKIILKTPPNLQELTKNIKIDIHVSCEIGKIRFNFIILDPFCTLSCSDIKVSLDQKCEISVDDLQVVPVEGEIYHRSLLTKKSNSSLLAITINTDDSECFAVLSPCEFYIDYQLLLTLTQFMLATPFLKLKSYYSLTRSTSAMNSSVCTPINSLGDPPKDNNKEMQINYTSHDQIPHSASNASISDDPILMPNNPPYFSSALPFTLIFSIKELDISIPTSIELNGLPELQVHLAALLEIDESRFSINISRLSMNFFDILSSKAYPSFLSEVALRFSIKKEIDSSLSFKTNILDINAVISAADIYLFMQITESITKAMNALIFSWEENSSSSNNIRISNIDLITANTSFIICKDNRSSSTITPIFKCVVPPIMLEVRKVNNKADEQPVKIEIQPYIEYFNEVTGYFDFIIEPMNMKINADITDSHTRLGLYCSSSLNINLPLSALLMANNILNDVRESINQKSVNFSDLPNIWINNMLGQNATFVIGDNEFDLKHDRYLPVFRVSLQSFINFKVDKKWYSITPSHFYYPTYITPSIVVIKKPFEGGVMIVFQRCIQVENNLSFSLYMYEYDQKSRNIVFLHKIEPSKRQPISASQESILIFSGKDAPKNGKHTQLKISIFDKKSIQKFSIICKDRIVKCVKTVVDDPSVAARIVQISAQFVITNLLPLPVYIKNSLHPKHDKRYEQNIIKINRGESKDIDFIDNFIFTASLSFTDQVFPSQIANIKIDSKGPRQINIYNSETKTEDKCVMFFNNDYESSHTLINLYYPVVIFNKTTFLLQFNNKGEKIEVAPNSHQFWCPSSIFESNTDSLMVTVNASGNSKCESDPFDCFAAGRSTLFLQSMDKDGLYVPLRYYISNHDQTSVITFSSLLTVFNNLSFDINLEPVLKIYNQASERDLHLYGGLQNKQKNQQFSTFNFPSKSEVVVPILTLNGSFLITVDGYLTSPSLSLFEPQKTVFRVQNQKDFVLIELQVFDIGTGIRSEFRNVTFPTPILINNQLNDVTIMAFQQACLTPFEIEPNSTSLFAFDEPFAFPEVSISFGMNNNYRISLVEDTNKVEMPTMYKGKRVFIQIKHNKVGNRLVIVSQNFKDRQEEKKYAYIFESSFRGIAASIIDQQMREIALVQLNHMKFVLSYDDQYFAISLQMKSFQIDDQNPLAPMPPLIYGRESDKNPFLSINCICPSDTELFTMFDYLSINIQRIDIDVDCSFISDIINLIPSLSIKKNVHEIKPAKPKKIGTKSDLVTIKWLDIIPPYLLLHYHRKTKRPVILGNIHNYFTKIPSIKSGKMLLPGVVISQLTDRIESIATKLVDDYKTAAFNQILEMLGSGGKLIKRLGIASVIASALSISMTSDMTQDLDINKELLNSLEYDNRKMVTLRHGCFSEQSLSDLFRITTEHDMKISPLVLKILTNEYSGLKMKLIPGFGYGRGIAGIMTKPMNDRMPQIAPMSEILRVRNPRAFPEYQISPFNQEIAAAQTIIYKSGGINEKMRVLSKVSKSKKIIIMTDTALYLFTSDLRKLLGIIKIVDIKQCEMIMKNHSVKICLMNGKTIYFEIQNPTALNFFFSQFQMTKAFHESLLL
ncbi:hypothetical protein TRFO_03923 [Tritrichomonas foetus]|uniref:Chorein N-terminal domain-containing protein n=1 Tax=Tritrichomonas foetus TaxID=1144522 RepID=A0A1J4KQH2_9EUKA|nr:hypothetical protein TRFO_03923 [Tritrichomonas foetus]|eukprot:OHT11685.1 hypothetical protein TRFO_03923 [Tritrichomonas foetus]